MVIVGKFGNRADDGNVGKFVNCSWGRYFRKVRQLKLWTVFSESSSIVAGDGISGKYCTVLYETLTFY